MSPNLGARSTGTLSGSRRYAKIRNIKVTGYIMANHRTIPDDRRWLSNMLHRMGIEVSPDDDAGIARICNGLPTETWAKLKSAYRMYSKRHGDAYATQVNQHHSNTRTLGAVWERLITMQCVTRADAKTLASTMTGLLDGAGYCDPFARDLVRRALAEAAKHARGRKTNKTASGIKIYKPTLPLVDALSEHNRKRDSVLDVDKPTGTVGLVKVRYVTGSVAEGLKYFYVLGAEGIGHDAYGNPLDDDGVLFDGVVEKDGDVIGAIREAIANHCPNGFHAVNRKYHTDSIKEVYQHRHGEQIKANGWQDKYPDITKLELVDIVGNNVTVLAIKRGVMYIQTRGVNTIKPDGNVHLLRAIKVKIKDIRERGVGNGIFTKEQYEKMTRNHQPRTEQPLTENIDAKLKQARSDMQRHHPDKGGDADQFIKAREEYQALKAKQDASVN